jgi:hypothetical protein
MARTNAFLLRVGQGYAIPGTLVTSQLAGETITESFLNKLQSKYGTTKFTIDSARGAKEQFFTSNGQQISRPFVSLPDGTRIEASTINECIESCFRPVGAPYSPSRNPGRDKVPTQIVLSQAVMQSINSSPQ